MQQTQINSIKNCITCRIFDQLKNSFSEEAKTATVKLVYEKKIVTRLKIIDL